MIRIRRDDSPSCPQSRRPYVNLPHGAHSRIHPVLPAALQPDIDLFIRSGLAILAKIERAGYNVWRARPVLAKWDKALLLGGALWRRLDHRRGEGRRCGGIRRLSGRGGRPFLRMASVVSDHHFYQRLPLPHFTSRPAAEVAAGRGK